MVAQGLAPVVTGSQEGFRSVEPERWYPVPAHGFRKIGPYSMHFTPGFWGWLETFPGPVDIVSLQSIWQANTAVALRWCGKRRIPYLITPHGTLNERALDRAPWKKAFAKTLYADGALEHAACIQALNEAEYRAIRNYGLRAPVCIIPNGIRIRPQMTEPVASIRKRLGLDPCLRLCLYLGRIHPVKGLDTLLKSWFAVTSTSKGWVLAIVGPDSNGHLARLNSLMRGKAASAAIIYPGPKFGAEKEDWLAASDVCVLPSRSEGFPMAALEYMASAKPVVLTKACNLTELVGAAAGFEADGTEDSLSQCLRAAMSLSDAERRDMGQRGLLLAQREFTWPAVVRDLIQVYDWVLGEGVMPPSIRLA